MDKRQSLINDNRSKTEALKLYEELKKRASIGTCSNCPVEQLKGFVSMCLSESCGKCVPCRVGLKTVENYLGDILEGEAEASTLAELKQIAKTMFDGSDCAIGFEAGREILNVLESAADDFKSHIESDRCLAHFEPVPCRAGCPAHVDIPAYIALTKDGRYKDAVKVIRYDNPLPSVCALVCEHPCEASCRRNLIDDAVNIRGIKRMAIDNAGIVPTPERMDSTGKKIAVIGGGPSGLTAAYYLSLMGHEVTVFEQRKKLGGMTRYGIPRYRLPDSYLDGDINAILSTGVKVVLEKSIFKEDFENLKKDYDAVYISIGAHKANTLGIEGEDAEGVLSAVQLLRDMGDGNAPVFKGKDVVIVGGGNVAMDCTRTAKRLGAKSVKCVYRRRQEDMTALPEEVEGAIAEGCEMVTMMAPISVEVKDGKVVALIAQPQIPGLYDKGRPKPCNSDKKPVRIKCDVIVSAIGQAIDSARFEEAGVPTKKGRFVADSGCYIESDDSLIFAGGDALSGPSTVIRAVEAGKVAAANIDKALGFEHVLDRDVEIPQAHSGSKQACGRINLPEREASKRKSDFKLMENKMTKQEAAQECSRCLRCDHYGFGAFCEGRAKPW